MTNTIGEGREAWGMKVWAMAEDFANSMKHETKPFYIVYAAKHDKNASQKLGVGAFKQTMKAYYKKPPKILGLLVWFVNNPMGIFEFQPDLSFPPDVPVDPKLLSEKASDALPSVMEKGKQMNVLLS